MAGSIVQKGRAAWRKYNTDGVSASGFYKPEFEPIAAFVDEVDAQIDEAVQAAADSGEVRENTWLELVASTKPGLNGFVPSSDTGTHTDPITGETVPNAGLYTKVGGLWEWFDSDSSTVLKADVDANTARLVKLTDNYAIPEDYSGSFPYQQINNAIASGKHVWFGSGDRGAGGTLIQLKADRTYWGNGALLRWPNPGALLKVDNRTVVKGFTLYGPGKGAALNQIGVMIPSGVGGVEIDVAAVNWAGPVVQNNNNASRVPSRIRIRAYNCLGAYESAARGEYADVEVYAGGTTGTPGARTGTAVKLIGGNHTVRGQITEYAIALDIQNGTNGDHSSAIGMLINHNDIAIKAGVLALNDFLVQGCKIYGNGSPNETAIQMTGTRGLIIDSCGMHNVKFIEDAAKHCIVRGTIFYSDPIITPNANGNPSCVFYYDNEFPDTVAADDPIRLPTGRSKVHLSTDQTVGSTTLATVELDTVDLCALQRNTSFTAYTMYDADNFRWTGKGSGVLVSPCANGRLNFDLRLTAGAASTFSDGSFDLYLDLCDGSDTILDRIPFARSSEFTDGSDKKRIFRLAGSFSKAERIYIKADNRGGSAVKIFAHASASKPSFAYVDGF